MGSGRRRWSISALLALLLGSGITTAATAGAPAGGAEKPQSTEVGITSTEIHIAVIADVDNPVVPNLFKGSRDSVIGFAKYVNATGGLAGRKLVVDAIDSKLNPNITRNALIQACQQDVAMVGTSAVFLNSVDEMRNCKDQAGQITGIPDLPFLTLARAQQCSDQTFPLATPQVICATKDQHPQTYQANIGRAFYYQRKFGNDLHGVYVFGNDSKAGRDAGFTSGLGQMRAAGVRSDEDFDRSGRAQQSEYTAVVQSIKSHQSNFAESASDANAMVLLRREARLQGVDSVKVWDCGTQCYSTSFLSAGGSDVEGQYVDVLYLPVLDAKERKANKMLANFVKYTGVDRADGFGIYAWSAAVAFRDAVKAVVAEDGVNGITRKSIFAALNNIHQFDADGMFGRIDLARRGASPCHVLLQVEQGKFVRVSPSKPGTFDCTPRNVVHVKLDLPAS